ncbi:hypothetical protein DFH05DRAFT_1404620, partial [Lentinula detonsa]
LPFQFIYPQRFPSLTDLTIGSLTALTEAAEKYEVFALMHICEESTQSIRRSFMRQHPKQILKFAARHDHLERIQGIAPIIFPHTRLPLSELYAVLTLYLYMPWVSKVPIPLISTLLSF